jgi:hypothetical protein
VYGLSEQLGAEAEEYLGRDTESVQGNERWTKMIESDENGEFTVTKFSKKKRPC